MKQRHKQSLVRGAIISGVIVVILVASFLLMIFLKAPAGSLDVVFNIDAGVNAQSIQIAPSGEPIFLGDAEGEFKILAGNGSETASISLGKPILQIEIDHQEKIVIIRTLLRLTAYTFDGKLSWELMIPDYLPEKIQMLPQGRVGIYFRNGRGEQPMVGVYDVKSGVAELSMKLEVQQTDINPTFMPSGQSIVFEVIPGMVAEVALKEGLPIIWKAHLDTYDNRFSQLESITTNSNFVVCYFKVDSKLGIDDRFREIYAFDPSKVEEVTVEDESASPELPPAWRKRVEGEIVLLDSNPSQDTFLIQARDVTIFNRKGEVIASETTNTGFFFCTLGDSRYMSSYFLEAPASTTYQVMLEAKGIGREGVLWRRSETMTNMILPVVTPDCEKILMVLPETGRILLLKTRF